jgi:hypothetical protein
MKFLFTPYAIFFAFLISNHELFGQFGTKYPMLSLYEMAFHSCLQQPISELGCSGELSQ